MCPTLLGRLETRFVILLLPALIGLIVSLATGEWAWLGLIGLYYVLGSVIDLIVYGPILTWQPPWLTPLLGVAEFVFLLVLALVLGFNVPIWLAAIYYAGVWIVAHSFRIAVLPLFFLTRIEDGGELRRIRWSVLPKHEQLPLLALEEYLPERLTGVWARPSQVGGALPPPSQIGEVPKELLAAFERAAQRG